MEIHEKIKARRIELGLTVEDLAKMLGVSKGTVSKYESNAIKNMGIDKIEILANALRVTPAYLMGWGSGPVPKTEAEAAAMVDKEGRELADAINQLSPEDREWAIGMIRRLKPRG